MLDLGHTAHSRQNLVIAIVGHTNVGKTTLMRTLLWDQSIGEVDNQRATTQHIERSTLYFNAGGQRYGIHYLDTPGMESSLYFYRAIEQTEYSQETYQRDRGLSKAQIMRAVNNAPLQEQFPVEVNCIKQGIYADICLYVIDTRQPLLAKYLVEMDLMHSLHKPLVIILNYATAKNSLIRDWVSYLIAHGFHSHLEFDPMYNHPSERQRLFDLMSVIGPEYQTLLRGLNQQGSNKQQERLSNAAMLTAELLVKLSAYRIDGKKLSQELALQTTSDRQEWLLDQINLQIQPTIAELSTAIIRSYGFADSDVQVLLNDLSAEENSLFEIKLKTIQSIAQESQTGALAGAATGLGLDAAFAGMSLGAAALIGAVTGSMVSLRDHTSRFWKQLRNGRDVCIDADSIIQTLQHIDQLITSLELRGHGAKKQLQLTSTLNLSSAGDESNQPNRYTKIINHRGVAMSQLHPDWFQADFNRNVEAMSTIKALSEVLYDHFVTTVAMNNQAD